MLKSPRKKLRALALSASLLTAPAVAKVTDDIPQNGSPKDATAACMLADVNFTYQARCISAISALTMNQVNRTWNILAALPADDQKKVRAATVPECMAAFRDQLVTVDQIRIVASQSPVQPDAQLNTIFRATLAEMGVCYMKRAAAIESSQPAAAASLLATGATISKLSGHIPAAP